MLHLPRGKWELPDRIPDATGAALLDWIARHPPDASDPFPSLPDDDRRRLPSGLSFAAGAVEGIGITGGAAPDTASRVGELILACVRARTPSRSRLSRLYRLLCDDGPVSYVDQLLTRLRASANVEPQRLRELALWLVRLAPDRGPLKLGIALLNLVGAPQDVELLMTVGGHEEFTLYCVVVLGNLLPPPEAQRAILSLAQRTRGWGRIQAVRRLDVAALPETRDWLLRDGFRNAVMNEELAHVVATSADLAGALEPETIDRELLRGAGDLLAALIGSPFQGLDDYPDGARAVRSYLRHARTSAADVHDCVAVEAVHRFLTDDDGDWEQRRARGWTPRLRQESISVATEILARPMWRDLALEGLAGDDRATFAAADRVARERGISTVAAHLERLRRTPLDAWHWACALSQVSGEELDSVIALAEELVRPADIATGPAAERGVDARFPWHGAVEAILRGVARHPRAGTAFVLAALRCPVTRTRATAAHTLERWGREQWPPEAEPALRSAAAIEPDERVRAQMHRLLT